MFLAGKEYKLVRVNYTGGMSMANPALVQDRLILRNQNYLFSIREKR